MARHQNRPPHPRRDGGRTPPPNHHGTHVLRRPEVAHRLVAASGVGPGDLVFDLGAGPGAITLALAHTGARVVAVERDPRLVRRLARRVEGRGDVRVVAGDLRRVPLPRRPYYVVANVPFSTSSHLLRRLLGDPTSHLAGGELLVEWGFARRVTEPRTPGREVERWQRSFDLVLVARVPARCFSPVPAVDAAHLSITRR